MEIRPLAAELSMWKDGQTDMTKLTAAFDNCANAPKKRHLKTLKANSALFGAILRPQRAVQMDIPSYFNDTADDYGTTCIFQGWIPLTGFLLTIYRNGHFVLETW
jgi:hypothetical protein